MKIYICENYKTAKWRRKILRDEKVSLAFAKLCVCDYIGEKLSRIEFAFSKNKYGKPFISSLHKKKVGRINRNVCYSLSHSGDILICAVSRYNIGADCQIINISDAQNCRKIAERFYSSEENQALSALDGADYIDKFFKIWTMKEAYIKYTGKGLAEGLTTFSVYSPGDVYFKRVRTRLPVYIYLCCGRENTDILGVKYII